MLSPMHRKNPSGFGEDDRRLVPSAAACCTSYVARTGALAYLDRCARCNAREEHHHKRIEEIRPKFTQAKEQRWWLLRDVASDLGWPFNSRLGVLVDACEALKALHAGGWTYGAGLKATAIMVGEDGQGGLRRPVPMPVKLDALEQRQVDRCKEDVLKLAKVVFSLFGEKVLVGNESLMNLYEQMSCEDASIRLDTEGVHAWIESLLEERKGRGSNPPQFSSSRHPFYGYIDLITKTSLEKEALEGYDSDESYMPPYSTEKSRIHEHEDNVTGDEDDESSMTHASDGDDDSTGGCSVSGSGSRLQKYASTEGQKTTTRERSNSSRFNVFLASMDTSSTSINSAELGEGGGRRRSATDDGSGSPDHGSIQNLNASVMLEGSARTTAATRRRPSGKPFRVLSSAVKKDFRKSWDQSRVRKLSLAVPSPQVVAEKFDRQERLSEEEASALVSQAEQVMRREPNVLEINDSRGEIQIFGDIHGQYFDFRNALAQSGYSLVDNDDDEQGRTLVFLGDLVDRGAWSCEVLLFVLALKVARPSRVFLLRGNHEASAVASYFGFKEEMETKYGIRLFHLCIGCFQTMPLCGVLATHETKWFLCHGGLSPKLNVIDDIREINRFSEPGMNGLFCDLLWSDPFTETEDLDPARATQDFTSNLDRQCSVRFGRLAANRFLDANGLNGVIRAHEVVEDGVKYHYDGRVITVFSAPNYCGKYGNKAAYLVVKYEGKEPISVFRYDAAPAQPEPAMFDSASQQLSSDIANSLPFMPTTLDGFVNRALQVWPANVIKEVQEEANAIRASVDEGSTMSPGTRPASSSTENIGTPLTPKGSFTMQSSTGTGRQNSALMGRDSTSYSEDLEEYVDDGENDEAVDEPTPFSSSSKPGLSAISPFLAAKKRLSRAMSKLVSMSMTPSKFQSAKFSDGINEAHPSLTQFKLQSAELLLRMRSSKNASVGDAGGGGSDNEDGSDFKVLSPLAPRKLSDLQHDLLNSRRKSAPLNMPSPVEEEYHQDKVFETFTTGPPQESPLVARRNLFEDTRRSSESNVGKSLENKGNFSTYDANLPHPPPVGGTSSKQISISGEKPIESTFDVSSPPTSSSARNSSLMRASAGSLRRITSFHKHHEFTEKELHNIQLLFMLLDRTDDGEISYEEIVAYSNNQLSETDAKAVVLAMDADGDGVIGLEDWLWFAHCCHQVWLEERLQEAASAAAAAANNSSRDGRKV